MTSRRTIAIVGIGLVVLLIAGVIALFTLPASIDPASTEFETANASVFESSGSIEIGSETFVSYEGAVGPNGSAYLSSYRNTTGGPTKSKLVRELYREDGIMYAKLKSNNSIHVERHQQSYGMTIISQSEDKGAVTTILRTDTPEEDFIADIEDNNDLIVRNLEVVEYDRTDNTIKKPQNGWYDGGSPYRVTNANGTVRTDSSGTVVMKADVDFRRTMAGTWAQYFFDPLRSVHQEINYEYQAGSPNIETPEWVAEIRANQTES